MTFKEAAKSYMPMYEIFMAAILDIFVLILQYTSVSPYYGGLCIDFAIYHGLLFIVDYV